MSNHLSIAPSAEKRLSMLGTPVFSDLLLKREADSDQEGFYMDSVLLTVSQQKNIVTTAVQGRAGTVKEYISDGDYSVSIDCKVVSDSDYPESEIKKLIAILKEPDSLVVVSKFLNEFFEIQKLVITNYSAAQQAGRERQQDFQIEAISDTDFIAQIEL